MIQRWSKFWLAALLTVGAGAAVQAGSCGPAGCPAGGAVGAYGALPYGPYEINYGGWNRAWLYPDGGFTVYPGEPGSCIQGHSDYSHVGWIVPPAVNAQRVLDKLQTLGIPLVPPEPMFLGKIPHVADHVKLPTPKGWTKDAPKVPQKEVEKVKPVVPPIGKPKPDADKEGDQTAKFKDLFILPTDK